MVITHYGPWGQTVGISGRTKYIGGEMEGISFYSSLAREKYYSFRKFARSKLSRESYKTMSISTG